MSEDIRPLLKDLVNSGLPNFEISCKLEELLGRKLTKAEEAELPELISQEKALQGVLPVPPSAPPMADNTPPSFPPSTGGGGSLYPSLLSTLMPTPQYPSGTPAVPQSTQPPVSPQPVSPSGEASDNPDKPQRPPRKTKTKDEIEDTNPQSLQREDSLLVAGATEPSDQDLTTGDPNIADPTLKPSAGIWPANLIRSTRDDKSELTASDQDLENIDQTAKFTDVHLDRWIYTGTGQNLCKMLTLMANNSSCSDTFQLTATQPFQDIPSDVMGAIPSLEAIEQLMIHQDKTLDEPSASELIKLLSQMSSKFPDLLVFGKYDCLVFFGLDWCRQAQPHLEIGIFDAVPESIAFLEVLNAPLGDQGVQAVMKCLFRHPKIVGIRLGLSQESLNSDVELLKRASEVQRIKAVYLYGIPLNSPAVTNALKQWKNVEVVQIDDTVVNSELITQLVNSLNEMTALKRLRLGDGCTMDAAENQTIAEYLHGRKVSYSQPYHMPAPTLPTPSKNLPTAPTGIMAGMAGLAGLSLAGLAPPNPSPNSGTSPIPSPTPSPRPVPQRQASIVDLIEDSEQGKRFSATDDNLESINPLEKFISPSVQFDRWWYRGHGRNLHKLMQLIESNAEASKILEVTVVAPYQNPVDPGIRLFSIDQLFIYQKEALGPEAAEQLLATVRWLSKALAPGLAVRVQTDGIRQPFIEHKIWSAFPSDVKCLGIQKFPMSDSGADAFIRCGEKLKVEKLGIGFHAQSINSDMQVMMQGRTQTSPIKFLYLYSMPTYGVAMDRVVKELALWKNLKNLYIISTTLDRDVTNLLLASLVKMSKLKTLNLVNCTFLRTKDDHKIKLLCVGKHIAYVKT